MTAISDHQHKSRTSKEIQDTTGNSRISKNIRERTARPQSKKKEHTQQIKTSQRTPIHLKKHQRPSRHDTRHL